MVLPLGHNSLDEAKILNFVKDIDEADDELEKFKSEHMIRCKGPRKKIREATLAAKAAGLDMPAFRALIAERRDERKIERRRDGLEPGEAESLDRMREALGDYGSTELGQAALKRAEGNAALDSLLAG